MVERNPIKSWPVHYLLLMGPPCIRPIRSLRDELDDLFLYNQVYNAWLGAISSQFRLDSDPIVSTKKCLELSEELEICYNKSKPFGIGVLTGIGK